MPTTSNIALDTANLHTWLELEALKLGTDNQRERYAAQLLPEDELTALARTELFKVFGDTHRWKAITKTEVKHSNTGHGCGGADGRHVTFETCDVGELAHDEWENLKLITQMVNLAQRHTWLVRSGGKVTIACQSHWASCATCESEVCRSSAKVSIEWAGRILTREYAL